MEWKSGRNLREAFISFFEERGHKHYKSFPLVPDDPTVLFTIAGMVPFKPYFLGAREPEVKRAVTAQKCLRTNDIDNVGRTGRHHTFFEMLGNFSFGDYFKEQAIPWGWEFLTRVIGLEADRMYATIYRDDDEAFEIWHKSVGLPEERIVRLGEDDNFWAVGPVGPCGPCSELIYDQGPEFSCGLPSCGVGCSCDRYLEVWNLVFMQYDRDAEGALHPLPKKNIDTGMGLERLCSVVQRAKNDFGTDLFRPIVERVCALAGIRYGSDDRQDMAVRVISDHIRAMAFLVADRVLPSNEGRGYVLRRIIRRSIRYGRLIGLERPFLADILPVVIDLMADPYEELVESRSTIEQVLELEERRFARTLEQGSELLEAEIASRLLRGEKLLPGDVAFVLYDTYGFPLELTEEICKERGLSVDREGFAKEMERQRELARAAGRRPSALKESVYLELYGDLGDTPFEGYTLTEVEAEVLAIVKGGARTDSAEPGDEVEVFLSSTPFYAQRGGQVGDKGWIKTDGARLRVDDVKYAEGGLVSHLCTVEEGRASVGIRVRAIVDEERRWAIRRHHTATHLLHEAAVRVLGPHVRQAGSLVTPEYLRLDLAHFAPISNDETKKIEEIVNAEIQANVPLQVFLTSLEDARAMGAKALFEEKYGEEVRVVRIPGFCAELCGGTHVDATGDIGLFKIVREEGIGADARRITAMAGMPAFNCLRQAYEELRGAAERLGADMFAVCDQIGSLQDEIKFLRRALEEAKLQVLAARIDDILSKREEVGGVSVVTAAFDGADVGLLRELGDRVKSRQPRSLVVLASRDGARAQLVIMADEAAVRAGIHAGKLAKEVASLAGGGGGGKAQMAQVGGIDPSKVEEALSGVPDILRRMLSS